MKNPTRRPGWLVAILLTVLLVNLAGCGGTTDPPVATTVMLSPTTLSFSSFGETQQLTATVLDQNGTTISSGASVTWESSSSSVIHEMHRRSLWQVLGSTS